MFRPARHVLSTALTAAALIAAASLSSAEEATHPTDQGEINLSDHGYFFVGGNYRSVEGGDVMDGSMYVEHFRPREATRPYPIVLIHGGGQTGTNFTGTPDGRRGWAHDFLRAGYEVYVVADAIGGVSVPAHEAAMQRMIQAGARPISVMGLACELQRDWGRPNSDKLRALFRFFFRGRAELESLGSTGTIGAGRK